MIDKVNKSIEVLKTAAKISNSYYNKPIIIAYSGGKDSDVVLDLAIRAEIEIEVLYSTTTVDAPQTMKHISEVFKQLQIMGIKTERTKPRYKGKPINMFSLIQKKGTPPTRLMRYCCSVFKENSTPYRITAVGVRASESRKRQGRSDFSSGRGRTAKYFNLEHVKEVFKDAAEQDPVWDCTIVANARNRKKLIVNPIYEWNDNDVWTYIKENKIRYNPLYDMGYSRVGCVLCPMARRSERKRDEANFPQVRENYKKAFARMLETRKLQGKTNMDCWTDEEAVYRWWMEDDSIPGQIKINYKNKIIGKNQVR